MCVARNQAAARLLFGAHAHRILTYKYQFQKMCER